MVFWPNECSVGKQNWATTDLQKIQIFMLTCSYCEKWPSLLAKGKNSERGKRTEDKHNEWSYTDLAALSVTVQECLWESNEGPQEVSPVAVDVTAGQRPSIWSTGLIGNTALCRCDLYDGHLRAESHDTSAADSFNKVIGCRGHNGRFPPTEM